MDIEALQIDYFIIGGAYALTCNYLILKTVKKLNEKYKKDGC